MWIKRKVVMLPTDEKAINSQEHNGIWLYEGKTVNLHFWGVPQHLYFLSDEEIKVGDWFYTVNSGLVHCDKLTDTAVISNKKGFFNPSACKKIIATTDEYLELPYNGGRHEFLPQPSKSFIKKFVEEYNKGNVITEVMVEYEELIGEEPFRTHLGYALKVNSKDNTITIRKVKDSWNSEELRSLLVEAYSMGRTDKLIGDFNRWIEKIL